MKVTVTRSFTYDLDEIKNSWLEIHGIELDDDEVMEQLENFAYEDLRSAISRHELVFIDSDTGEEL